MKHNESSRDLELLVPGFRELVKEVIQRCAARKVPMVPFFTLRGPGVQAQLWCQSRTMKQAQDKSKEIQRAGAPWLASLFRQDFCKDYALRQPTDDTSWKTNAVPGISWHQWGKAVDCYVQGADGKPIWDSNHFGYEVYAEEAKRMGLEAGAFWTNRDAVHVQATVSHSPVTDGKLWPAIEAEMSKRWREAK